MHFRIHLVAVADDGTEHRDEIADLIRAEAAIETTGLTLAESKQVRHALQRRIVERQVADYAALVSYELTAQLLHEVLPIDEKHGAVTLRNHTLAVARRSEERLGAEQAMFLEGTQDARDRLPIPDGPLAVG